MREILFRGKASSGKWEYGVPVFSGLNNEIAYIKQMHSYDARVIPETVGQYSGLIDMNGNRIFEGDILIGAWNTKIVVYFDECYLQFRAREVSTHARENAIDYYNNDKLEIVGNIYDNPELLKVAAHG